MSATETLRNDHKQIKRLDKIISKCYSDLNAGKTIPFSDLEKITIIISEFLDLVNDKVEFENKSKTKLSNFEKKDGYNSFKNSIFKILDNI